MLQKHKKQLTWHKNYYFRENNWNFCARIQKLSYLCKHNYNNTKNLVSNFTNKSEIYLAVAENAESKYLYPAVAHCAYYSCIHLMQHIWYYKMGKTKNELDQECTKAKSGLHNILINKIGQHIKGNTSNRNAIKDFHDFNNKIAQLKRLRVDADYKDDGFDISKGSDSIALAKDLIPILKRA